MMGKFEKELLWRKKVEKIACLKALNAQIFNSESEGGNGRERKSKGREIVTSVEEVSEERGECSRKGWVIVENYGGNFIFGSFSYGFQRCI